MLKVQRYDGRYDNDVERRWRQVMSSVSCHVDASLASHHRRHVSELSAEVVKVTPSDAGVRDVTWRRRQVSRPPCVESLTGRRTTNSAAVLPSLGRVRRCRSQRPCGVLPALPRVRQPGNSSPNCPVCTCVRGKSWKDLYRPTAMTNVTNLISSRSSTIQVLRRTNTADTAFYSSVRQTSTALRTCCQVRCADGPFESTARSYFRVTESLEASSRLTQTVMDENRWVHSASVCSQHGHELRIVNNGNELWKRLRSIMVPALDDDDSTVQGGSPRQTGAHSVKIC